MTKNETLAALTEGTKIIAGAGADREPGRIVAVDGERVTVRWDHGYTTTQHVDALTDLEIL